MATVYGRLGALSAASATNTTLYESPSAASAVIAALVICNTGSAQGTFKAGVTSGAASAVASGEWVYYDIPVPGNDTFIATSGITMGSSFKLVVANSAIEIVFSAFGSEVS